MKIGPLGITEIVIILLAILILIVLGPKNLPKLGTAIGKGIKNLREGLGGKKKIDEKDENGKTKEADSEKKDSAEASKSDEEAEVIEVIDKPEPGRKSKSEGSKDE
jgi:sec-independent protein translocase protein TatA